MLMLDAAEWSFIAARMADGTMPELAALRQRSQYLPLSTTDAYVAEAGPTVFVTGRSPSESGYWSMLSYDPEAYQMRQGAASMAAPFYAHSDPGSTIIFDVPHMAIHRDIDAVQVAAWGSHAPQWPRSSHPHGLLQEIDDRFGPHPGFAADYQTCWYRPDYAEELSRVLIEGTRRRMEVAAWLLGRQPGWRLFATGASELHAMLHHTQHAFDPHHPLHGDRNVPRLRAATLAVAAAVDGALGAFVRSLPTGTTPIVCAVHGMRSNSTDVGGDVILPELLARTETGRARFQQRPSLWAVRGKRPIVPTGRLGGGAEMGRTFATSRRLRLVRLLTMSDTAIELKRTVRRLASRPNPDPFPSLDDWPVPAESPIDAVQPERPVMNLGAAWLQPWWREMRWFALPSFSDGHIRINLQGRESSGRVALDDYGAACDEIESLVCAMRDARTGAPVVAQVLRPRADDPIASSGPAADVIVKWTDTPFDAIVLPGIGRIGPFPFQRTGQHSSTGFALVGSEPGAAPLPGRPVQDLVRTACELAGLATQDLPGSVIVELLPQPARAEIAESR